MLHYITLYYTIILLHDILRNHSLCFVILCCVTLCYYILLYYIICIYFIIFIILYYYFIIVYCIVVFYYTYVLYYIILRNIILYYIRKVFRKYAETFRNPILKALSRKCDKLLLALSCLPVRPDVSMKQLGSHWTDFHEVWYLSILRKSVEKIQFSVMYVKHNGNFMWRRTYICDNISLNYS
jgi:hypothetical protein